MKIRSIKSLVLASLLSIPLFSYSGDNFKLSKYSKANAVRDDSSYDFQGCTVSVPQTTECATSVSTTVCSTTVTTTTENVDQFKNIRKFECLKNNDLEIEQLDIFIRKYASFSKLSYEDALNVLSENIESVELDYESIRGGIMCNLFSYSNNNGILSVYTNDKEIREDMNQQEKEEKIIEFCNNLSLCDDDISLILAVFREETGNGTSYRCINDNNYGGIRIYGEEGCNGEYGMYSTPEFGAYRHVKCIFNKLKNIRGNGNNDLESVVYEFAYNYNRDYASTYSSKILNWIYSVRDDYDSFNNDEFPKILTK